MKRLVLMFTSHFIQEYLNQGPETDPVFVRKVYRSRF